MVICSSSRWYLPLYHWGPELHHFINRINFRPRKEFWHLIASANQGYGIQVLHFKYILSDFITPTLTWYKPWESIIAYIANKKEAFQYSVLYWLHACIYVMWACMESDVGHYILTSMVSHSVEWWKESNVLCFTILPPRHLLSFTT